MVHLIGVYLRGSKYLAQQVALAPNNAVYGLTGCTPDCAYWVTLGCNFCGAIVACSDSLLDDLYLAIEARRSTLDQRYVSRKAHFVNMAAGIEVIERIEDDGESFEPVNVELGVFDVGVV